MKKYNIFRTLFEVCCSNLKQPKLRRLEMSTINLNKDNINEVVEGNKNIALDFKAEWCGPCKMFGPIFEKVSNDYDDVVFAKVDIDESPEIANYFNIRGVPTVAFIKNKELVYIEAGMHTEKKLRKIIDKEKDNADAQ